MRLKERLKMTWDNVEAARQKARELRVEYNKAKERLRSAESELSKVESEYVLCMGVDARYRSRHDPFHDIYEAYIRDEWRADYDSFGNLLRAVREAEVAGHLVNQTEEIEKLRGLQSKFPHLSHAVKK